MNMLGHMGIMVNLPTFGVTTIDLAVTVAGRRDDALGPVLRAEQAIATGL